MQVRERDGQRAQLSRFSRSVSDPNFFVHTILSADIAGRFCLNDPILAYVGSSYRPKVEPLYTAGTLQCPRPRQRGSSKNLRAQLSRSTTAQG